ncbi:transposase [Salmonirosea aquatica]|uniref:Transposase IS200-like domain-containing protein n=1 Tax=Salmonirosea aquatica TaxID=2654236 RepID=A0A7C9FDR2_9BACT|nr:hypothetical protein [Cytophagaceae bacterium SJW1-29]
MAKTEHYFVEFEDECFYHIYNRTIDSGKLFAHEGNFEFFLKRLDGYLSGFVEVYAFCLLSNHFHLLIKVSSEEALRKNLASFEEINSGKILALKKGEPSQKTVHEIVSHQFKKFFQSYAMAYNKQQDRVGTLFQTPFKRVKIDNDLYLTSIIKYIHTNPRKHGVEADFRTYRWSSYSRILLEKPTKLRKEEVLEWFGGRKPFVNAHEGDFDLPNGWGLEE